MFMFIYLISGVKSNQKSYTIHPHPHILTSERQDYIFTSSGTPTLKTSTPPSTSALDGIFPLLINSAHFTITGSIPIVATATTVSPRQ